MVSIKLVVDKTVAAGGLQLGQDRLLLGARSGGS